MKVPILTYHSLDDSGSAVSTLPRRFRDHVKVLRDEGFQGIRMSDLLDGWNGDAPLPPRPIVLSFDDGYRNVRDRAADILVEAGYRATIFAIADRQGRTNDWPGQADWAPRLPLLDGGALREIADAGFEIGSHGASHVALAGLSPGRLRDEVGGAQDRLQDLLGRPVSTFAYPYGVAEETVVDEVKRRHRGACGTELRTADAVDGRHRLPRIDMFYFQSPARLRLLPTIVGQWYVALRAAGRRCRATWARSQS